jgi:hypothetical protein
MLKTVKTNVSIAPAREMQRDFSKKKDRLL